MKLKPGKHGRGTGGAAPVFDAATRRGRRCPRVRPRPAASGHVDPTWFSPTRADTASTRADSGRLGPESAGIGRYLPESAGIGRNSRFRPKFTIKKKKKTPRTHRLLNSNPTSAQMHSKRQKHSSHYISLTVLSALVALCLSVF